jgi:hypothetical protein
MLNSDSITFVVQGCACCLLHAGFLLGIFCEHEDGGDMFLQKVNCSHQTTLCYSPEDATLHYFSYSLHGQAIKLHSLNTLNVALIVIQFI